MERTVITERCSPLYGLRNSFRPTIPCSPSAPSSTKPSPIWIPASPQCTSPRSKADDQALHPRNGCTPCCFRCATASAASDCRSNRSPTTYCSAGSSASPSRTPCRTTQNRDRLLTFDAITELFNTTVEMAANTGLLSGEHFNVNGTLIQAWTSHKSVRRKDRGDDDRPPRQLAWREAQQPQSCFGLN